MYDKDFYERHRDRLTEARREVYHLRAEHINARRRERYLCTREGVLARQRASRAVCPHCGKELRRSYLSRHVRDVCAARVDAGCFRHATVPDNAAE